MRLEFAGVFFVGCSILFLSRVVLKWILEREVEIR